MVVHLNSGDGGAKCGCNVFYDYYPNGFDSGKVNPPMRKIAKRIYVHFEDGAKNITATCKRCLNKIERPVNSGLDKDYMGTIFHRSFGYDMTINVYCIAIKQTAKGLLCKECDSVFEGDPWAGKGDATATAGSIKQDSKTFLMQKKHNPKYKNDYWTGDGNHWSIWDGRAYYENHCD